MNMELDLSVVTFSPSQNKKQNVKTSSSKKTNKLTLRPRRLISSKENYGTDEYKWGSSPRCNKNQNCELSSDAVISPSRKSGDKLKQRTARGKENRGININCIPLLLSDTSNIVNNTSSSQGCFRGVSRRRRKLSSDDNIRQCKRFSAESAKSETNYDYWAFIRNSSSKEVHGISGANKNAQHGTRKPSVVLANESAEQSFTKPEVCDRINESSIIVISDSGEDTANGEVRDADVSMKSVESSKDEPTYDEINIKRGEPHRFVNTIILETSESASENSNECNRISAPEPQNTKTSPNIVLKIVPDSAPLYKEKEHLDHLENKFSNIKIWLDGVSPYDNKTTSVVKADVKSNKTKQKQVLDKKEKVKPYELNSSTARVLDEVYGSQWRSGNKVKKKAETEPHKLSKYRSVSNTPSDVSNSSCSSSSGTSSTDFERFLNERREGKFESTRRYSSAQIGTPEFINDSVNENSFGFYQNFHTAEIKTEAKKVRNILGTGSSNTPNTSISRRLSFSSSDDGATTPKTKSKKTTKESKKQKVLVSPVNSRLKTPKTEKPYKLKAVLKANQVSVHCSPVLSFLSSLSAEASKERCHPEALYYKQDFQKRKEELCRKLFNMYNSEVFDNKLPEDLLIQWSTRINKSAGLCYNKRTVKSPGTKVRTSRIVLSTKVCDTADRLRDTLIHELCHAACWIVDEIKDGHGHKWKSWARKAMSAFPELPVINRCHDYKIFTKYTYRCTRCGYSIGRHSKSLDIATKRCGYCYGVFELLLNTRRKSGTVAQKTPKKRSPAGFARFVKENYSTVKKTRSDLKHADVMKLLGQQFSAVKIGSA